MRFILLLIVLVQLKGHNLQQISTHANYDHNQDGSAQPYHHHHHQPNNGGYNGGSSLPQNSYGPSVPSLNGGYEDHGHNLRPQSGPSCDNGAPQQAYSRPNSDFHLPASQPNEIKLPQNIEGYQLVHTGEIAPSDSQNSQQNRQQIPQSIQQQNNYPAPQNYHGNSQPFLNNLPSIHNDGQSPQTQYPQNYGIGQNQHHQVPQSSYGNVPADLYPQSPAIHNQGQPSPIQYPQNYGNGQNNYHQVPQSSYGNVPDLYPQNAPIYNQGQSSPIQYSQNIGSGQVPQSSYTNVLPEQLYPQSPLISNEGQIQFPQNSGGGQNYHHQVPQSSYGNVPSNLYPQPAPIFNQGQPSQIQYPQNFGSGQNYQQQVPQSSYGNVPSQLYSQSPVENIYQSPQQRNYPSNPLNIPIANIYQYDGNYSTSQLSNMQRVSHQNIPVNFQRSSYQSLPLQHDDPLLQYAQQNIPLYQPSQSLPYNGHQNIPNFNAQVNPSYVSQSYGPQNGQYPLNHAQQNGQNYNSNGYQLVNELDQNQQGAYVNRPRQQNGQVDNQGYQIINEGPVDHFVSVGNPLTELITPRSPPQDTTSSTNSVRTYRDSRRQIFTNYVYNNQAVKEDKAQLSSKQNLQKEPVPTSGIQVEEPREESLSIPKAEDLETQKPLKDEDDSTVVDH